MLKVFIDVNSFISMLSSASSFKKGKDLEAYSAFFSFFPVDIKVVHAFKPLSSTVMKNRYCCKCAGTLQF